MMHKASQSLRVKLIFLLTAVAGVAVLASCAGLFAFQWHDRANALYRDSTTQAHLVAANSGAALLFGDAKAANETLWLLHGDPRVQLACLYDRSGVVVGKYHAPSESDACPAIGDARSAVSLHSIKLQMPITVGSEAAGTLFIDVSRYELQLLLVQFCKVSALTTLASIALALFLSAVSERWISRPILHLTDLAVRVSREGNYSLRAVGTSKDEVGVLIHHVNRMLTQIQHRDVDLRAAYDLMEQRVQERTKDLSNEIAERTLIQSDLEAAKTMAEESNQAKSRFLANMSHELRTPLNAIIGYSEMLAEDAMEAKNREAEEDIGKILSSARHLRGIISDVLDLSKIEAGEMKMHLETTSANTMLQDVVATAEVLSRANDNRLTVECLACDVEIQVDPLRFRQSLLNLVSNACKFTMGGEIRISVEQPTIAGRRYVTWSVRDTGPGISDEDKGKLFRSFSQIDSSATRRHGGTGLGLSISQEFCKAMGGYIDVISAVGAGSTFSLHIPLQA